MSVKAAKRSGTKRAAAGRAGAAAAKGRAASAGAASRKAAASARGVRSAKGARAAASAVDVNALPAPAPLPRCRWPGEDPLYCAYHDDEWGVPERDARALYEKLVLDGFQAGLAWITILRKRDGFRRAFEGFVPAQVARYGKREIARLLGDAGIVRHRGKIEGAIANARAFLEVEAAHPGGFSAFLWQFTGGRTLQAPRPPGAPIPAETPESQAMAKALKARGFKFCGPTICYAFMQAVGMVDDHLDTCFRRAGKGSAR
jgi:DNA-3-methyladenine glycosylase I